MRKGFEGLCALVAERLEENLRSGPLFVFGNRLRIRLKIPYFDGTGIWLMTKRLEEGTLQSIVERRRFAGRDTSSGTLAEAKATGGCFYFALPWLATACMAASMALWSPR
jgi:hypothetical protein